MKSVYTEEQKEQRRAYARQYYWNKTPEQKAIDLQRAKSPIQRARKKARRKERDKNEPPEKRAKRLAGVRQYQWNKTPERKAKDAQRAIERNKNPIRRAANKAAVKRWEKKYPEKAKAGRRRRDLRRREKKLLENKIWRHANRGRLSAYVMSRYRRDLNFKIKMNLRRRVREMIAKQKAGKLPTFKLLSCDIEWLMAWLEVQFQAGMTWENYGSVWHIDHKRPCASFDLIDPAQQKLCFHWTNLQPLFAAENIAKSDKWEYEAA